MLWQRQSRDSLETVQQQSSDRPETVWQSRGSLTVQRQSDSPETVWQSRDSPDSSETVHRQCKRQFRDSLETVQRQPWDINYPSSVSIFKGQSNIRTDVSVTTTKQQTNQAVIEPLQIFKSMDRLVGIGKSGVRNNTFCFYEHLTSQGGRGLGDSMDSLVDREDNSFSSEEDNCWEVLLSSSRPGGHISSEEVTVTVVSTAQASEAPTEVWVDREDNSFSSEEDNWWKVMLLWSRPGGQGRQQLWVRWRQMRKSLAVVFPGGQGRRQL